MAGITTDALGYIKYKGLSTSFGKENLQTEQTLFEIEGGTSEESFGPGIAGCNISFGEFADIDFNLPELSMSDLFNIDTDIDTSLFDKLDQLSTDVSMINNMLINAISDMGCCDIAGQYNTIMIPFMKFFADSDGDQSLMDIVVQAYEAITIVAGVMEIIECMLKTLPGNPWEPDADFSIIKDLLGPLKDVKPFLDKFMSGELVEIVAGPVNKLRQNMQACLSSSADLLTAEVLTNQKIGSPEQLKKLSKVAVDGGKQILESNIVKPKEPKKPYPQDYRGGENNQDYVDALESYEIAVGKYKKDEKFYKEALTEAKRQTEVQKSVSHSLAVSSRTNSLIKVRTDGLCGCIAKALDLDNSSPIPIPIRISKDLQNLVGITIDELTNKDAKTTSKDRPKDEDVTIQENDLHKKTTVEEVVNKGKSAGVTKKVTETTTTAIRKNPYEDLTGYEIIQIEIEVNDIETSVLDGDPYKLLENNDELIKYLNTVQKKASQNQLGKEKVQLDEFHAYKTYYKEAQKILSSYENNVAMTSQNLSIEADPLIKTYQEQSLEVARRIFNTGPLANYHSLDYLNDTDIVSFYIPDFTEFFPLGIWSTLDQIKTQLRLNGDNSWQTFDIPFPPNTPSQKIINSLDISTNVNVDLKTEVNFFDGGFVKRGGTLNWRNFNLLGVEYNSFTINEGAIGSYRGTVPHQAIFSTDEIGNTACVNYARNFYNSKILTNFIWDFLLKKERWNLTNCLEELKVKYGFDADSYIETFNDDEVFTIIKIIADFNEYVRGKLWAKVRRLNNDVYFGDEYVYEFIGNKSADIKYNNMPVTSLANSPLISAAGNPAEEMAKLNNDYIKERGKFFTKGLKLDALQQSNLGIISKVGNILDSSIASIVPGKVDVLIPCTCSNIICALINQIIKYFKALLERLIEEMLKTVEDFLLSFFEEIINQIKSIFKGCILDAFKIAGKLKKVTEAGDELLENMEGRIKSYPADPCFSPENIAPELDNPYEDYETGDYSIEEVPDEPIIPEIPETIYLSLVGPSEVIEGDISASYVAALDPAVELDQSLIVKFKYEDISAQPGTDYIQVEQVVLFSGSYQKNFIIGTLDNPSPEDKTFRISIDEIIYAGDLNIQIDPNINSVLTDILNKDSGSGSGSGSESGSGSGSESGSVPEPEPIPDIVPIISLEGPSLVEGDEDAGPFFISVNQDIDIITENINISLLYEDETAISGVDYIPLESVKINKNSNIVTFAIKTFASTETSKSFVVSVGSVDSNFEDIKINPEKSSIRVTILNEDDSEDPGLPDDPVPDIPGPIKIIPDNPIPGDPTPNVSLPIVVPPEVIVVPGLVGRHIPGYNLVCEYILI